MLPQHSNQTNEHYSPTRPVEAARAVMGAIDLDPASCALANETVRASAFFSKLDDGLKQKWHGRVWLNPPGGQMVLTRKEADILGEDGERRVAEELKAERMRWGTKARIVAWWRKLVEEHQANRVTEAVFAGFTIEILCTAQSDKWLDPLDFSCCFPKERLCFRGNQPTHANVIVYLGANQERFRKEFEPLGKVIGK